MIVFLGDSFTWGQGLQIPYWLEQGKTVDECNDLMPPWHPSELYDYYSDEYRKQHHFPNLVSKHFNSSYVTKWGNGGSNQDMYDILESTGQLMCTSGLEYIVVQFTELTRDWRLESLIENSTQSPEEFFNEYRYRVVDEISERINGYFNKPWFGFSWHSDIGDVLKEKYSENYIPIEYNGNHYNCFQTMMEHNPETTLASEFDGIMDGHMNSLGHRIISDSIIKKVENSDLFDEEIFQNMIPKRPI